jgi:ubiquinone/menaquinone biosynthesis C-methylase UbiE
MHNKNHVCPAELAGGLDNGIRRWLQNPTKILRPYCKPGMTALDLGCGPGFFSVEMARLVGAAGRVIACDLQDGMLRILGAKIKGSDLEKIISLHKCPEGKIGVSEPVDFILAFYMLHELPDQEKYFKELYSLLKSTGRFLAVEPPFHVSKNAFSETVKRAFAAGFSALESPRVFLGRTMVFKKA